MMADAPTRLDKLLAELKGLPDLENRHAVVDHLRAIEQRVQDATCQVQQAALTLQGLQSITGVPPSGAAEFTKLESAAQDLLEFLKSGKIAPGSRRHETLTTEIVEVASRHLKVAAAQWKTCFVDRAEAYKNLASAASDANLPGGRDLANKVTALSRLAQTLPSASEDVTTATATFEAVHLAIERLGIEGKAGEFLMAAVRGEASLDLLRSEDVQKFLSTHPTLTEMLRVRLL
jgi:hypothetical protein